MYSPSCQDQFAPSNIIVCMVIDAETPMGFMYITWGAIHNLFKFQIFT
jgi:hypothetical protein